MNYTLGSILNVHKLQIHVKTVLIVVKAWNFDTNEAFNNENQELIWLYLENFYPLFACQHDCFKHKCIPPKWEIQESDFLSFKKWE